MADTQAMLNDAWNGLLDLLAPPTCAACESARSTRESLCGACLPLLEEMPLAPPDAPHRAGFVYGGPIAEAIGRLKYRGGSHVAAALARLLEKQARTLAGKIELICVVPMHSTRLRERGYNQSALLAKPIAARLGLPFRPHLLRRVHATPAQVGADPERRRQQLRGAFLASERARGRNILIVDDVRTTGATLMEAERALREAGAQRVFTLTLAERVFE